MAMAGVAASHFVLPKGRAVAAAVGAAPAIAAAIGCQHGWQQRACIDLAGEGAEHVSFCLALPSCVARLSSLERVCCKASERVSRWVSE